MDLILLIDFFSHKRPIKTYFSRFLQFQWISQTVLCKVVKEIDEINVSLQKMGSSELQIGCKFSRALVL